MSTGKKPGNPNGLTPEMKLAQWKPGQSGNPGGRRKNPISDRYAVLAELSLTPAMLKKLKVPAEYLEQIKTVGDLGAFAQFHAMMKGSTFAAREITDRLEGKATARDDEGNAVNEIRVTIRHIGAPEKKGLTDGD